MGRSCGGGGPPLICGTGLEACQWGLNSRGVDNNNNTPSIETPSMFLSAVIEIDSSINVSLGVNVYSLLTSVTTVRETFNILLTYGRWRGTSTKLDYSAVELPLFPAMDVNYSQVVSICVHLYCRVGK